MSGFQQITNKKIKTLIKRTSFFSAVAFPLAALFLYNQYQSEQEQNTALAFQDEGSSASQTGNNTLTSSKQGSEANYFAEGSLEGRKNEPQPSLELAHDPDCYSRFEIGGDYTYVTIKPNSLSSFHGNLGGLQALYEYRPANFLYTGATFAWKEGNTHESSEKRSLLYIDAQERIGYTLASKKEDIQLTLFSGFGYRHLGQKLEYLDAGTLHFKYNQFYVPVGLLSNYDVNTWLSLGLDFTWMPQVYPTVSISSHNGVRWTTTNTISNFSVEVPIGFALTKNKRLRLTLSPFYEYWQDGHSTAKLSDGTSLGLPGNTYNFYGADVNFSYSF